MIPAAFADVRPEGGANVRAARSEDRERVARMLVVDASEWSDHDINLVMSRAQTTLGGPETFKWILPAFLIRSVANPDEGWITISSVLADKFDRAGFDIWPEGQRAATLTMVSDWLAAQTALFTDDPTYGPENDAELRAWLKARTP